jgi:hypothetical protein
MHGKSEEDREERKTREMCEAQSQQVDDICQKGFVICLEFKFIATRILFCSIIAGPLNGAWPCVLHNSLCATYTCRQRDALTLRQGVRRRRWLLLCKSIYNVEKHKERGNLKDFPKQKTVFSLRCTEDFWLKLP